MEATEEQFVLYARLKGEWCNKVATAIHTKWGDVSRAQDNEMSAEFIAEMESAHNATISYLAANEPTLGMAIAQLEAEAQAVLDEEAEAQANLDMVP